jgi:hypothetical protein
MIYDNDFVDSGMPPIGHPYNDACIFLDDTTSNCFVDQSGTFPEGQGGASNHVTDWGTDNRIIGQPANTSYGAPTKQFAEQKLVRAMAKKREVSP